MANSLTQIEQQIAKLQREAQALRAKEVHGVVSRIRVAIEHYGLTERDLFSGALKTRRRREGPAHAKEARAGRGNGSSQRRTIPVKYRDPASGATWAGRGSKPRWLVAALAAGKSADDFLIRS
jgi:DNA-binding protein H-NS